MLIFLSGKELVLKAKRPKWKVTRTKPRMEKLVDTMSGGVRVSLIHGIRAFKKRINPEQIYQAWLSKDYTGLFKNVPWEKLPEDVAPAFEKVKRASSRASYLSLNALPGEVKAKFRYDLSNPRLERYINTRTGNLIVDIQSGTQKVVQQAVARSFAEALSPRQVADIIYDSIGLLPRHEIAVRNYADGLREKGYTLQNIQKLSEGYANRLLDYRANMIARTETHAASNFGQISVWNEAARQGYIDRNSARKVWHVDGNPCPECQDLDGTSVGLDEVFVSESDAVDGPPLHPQCECDIELIFETGETELS